MYSEIFILIVNLYKIPSANGQTKTVSNKYIKWIDVTLYNTDPEGNISQPNTKCILSKVNILLHIRFYAIEKKNMDVLLIYRNS